MNQTTLDLFDDEQEDFPLSELLPANDFLDNNIRCLIIQFETRPIKSSTIISTYNQDRTDRVGIGDRTLARMNELVESQQDIDGYRVTKNGDKFKFVMMDTEGGERIMHLTFDWDKEEDYTRFQYESAKHDQSVLREFLLRTVQKIEGATDTKKMDSLELRRRQFKLLKKLDKIVRKYEQHNKEDV